ncbi:MAG: hypothetical protein KJ622_10905 [Alphaproteobacteria bacterium]|nr:hypothetical protein [Alphaproteobacteria bacterium]
MQNNTTRPAIQQDLPGSAARPIRARVSFADAKNTASFPENIPVPAAIPEKAGSSWLQRPAASAKSAAFLNSRTGIAADPKALETAIPASENHYREGTMSSHRD